MKTLSAIAREMGVSCATVSYVYHDKWREKRISPDLAARIQRKLERECGRPDLLGEQLRTGLTRTAGVVLPNLDQEYFLRLLAGLERRLGEDDYMLFLGNARRGSGSRQTELLERMVARRVDVVILSPVPADDLREILDRMRERDVPVVFVDNYVPDCDIPYTASDNHWGAKQAVESMLAYGRRRIVFVGGSPHIAALADRCAGYREALKKRSAEARPEWILWRDQAGPAFEASLQSLLASKGRPDAIFCDTLFTCGRIVSVMSESGLRHPDDVLLCGFDDPHPGPEFSVFHEVIRAPLLTVRQDAEAMGAAAAELALRAMAGKDCRSRLIRPALLWEALPEDSAAANAFASSSKRDGRTRLA